MFTALLLAAAGFVGFVIGCMVTERRNLKAEEKRREAERLRHIVRLRAKEAAGRSLRAALDSLQEL